MLARASIKDCALSRLTQQADAWTALVVTHGSPIHAVLALACGIPFQALWVHKIDHGARVAVRIESGNPMWGEVVGIVQV
jgi:broad specificity phosphatase PhoE